jgi:acyl-CoA hydrolase
VKRVVLLIAGATALVAAAAAVAAPAATTSARLVHVTSPVSRGDHATLTAHVVPARRCMITVFYKSGTSRAQGLYAKRPVHGRVSWTWMVGTNTTPGRWPIRVSCGSAGSFQTSFKVTR